jgi:hypothetical protein
VQPRRADALCPFDDISILFLERLRVRPIGYTVERAPFFELSLVPGETVSLSHESFAQRDLSQEDIFDTEESHDTALTSTLNTSLTSEYTSELSKTTSWKISPSASAEVTIPVYGIPVKLGTAVSGEYGTTATNSFSQHEAASRSQALTQEASSKLFRSHKTTVKVSTTQSETAKNAVTFTNEDDELKKIFMRRMMQVNHVSYERYGVRMVWSPCIDDPGRDVRDLVPGMAAFPKEIKAIHAKWDKTAPPADLGSRPETR